MGDVSRFPYSVLWQEFGELWEGLGRTDASAAKFEKLLADCAAAGQVMPVAVTAAAISDLLTPLKLAPAEHQQLVDTLYGLAAEYLIPKVRQALRQSPAQVERRLNQLARKATVFADALEGIDIDIEVVLGLLRSTVENSATSKPPIFHFRQLVTEARTLANAAALMSDELPRHAQGTSVDLLATRWVQASLRAIEFSGRLRIEILQADGAGRNPRPKGGPAEVLFDYLRLVEPGMPDATKVRLILEFTARYRKLEKLHARHWKSNI